MDIKNIQKVSNLLEEWHAIRFFLEQSKDYFTSKNIVINDLEYKPPFKSKYSNTIVPKLNDAIREVFEDVKNEIEDDLSLM